MTNSPLSRRDLVEAVARFDELLTRRSAEAEFQRLFSDCPFIFSRTLPLRLEPSEIVPLGRPGKSEPDFITFPGGRSPLEGYGIIELKRPDSRVFVQPRKDVLLLSKSAQTAIEQSRVYSRKLQLPTPHSGRLMMFGNLNYIFVIMGLSTELTITLSSELYAARMKELLPDNCRLIPYDLLLQTFRETVPPRLLVLVPDLPLRSTEKVAGELLEALRQLPDDPREVLILQLALGMDVREIGRALGRSDGDVRLILEHAVRELEANTHIPADRFGYLIKNAMSDELLPDDPAAAVAELDRRIAELESGS